MRAASVRPLLPFSLLLARTYAFGIGSSFLPRWACQATSLSQASAIQKQLKTLFHFSIFSFLRWLLRFYWHRMPKDFQEYKFFQMLACFPWAYAPLPALVRWHDSHVHFSVLRCASCRALSGPKGMCMIADPDLLVVGSGTLGSIRACLLLLSTCSWLCAVVCFAFWYSLALLLLFTHVLVECSFDWILRFCHDSLSL